MKFNDTKNAYMLKSDKELQKAYLLFRMISKRSWVRFGGKLTLLALRLGLPIHSLLRKTVYQQFCAGNEAQDSLKVVNQLAAFNVKSYMHYAAESQKSEEGVEQSLQQFLNAVQFSKQNKALPFVVFKPTALGKVMLFEKVSAGIQLSKEEVASWDRTKDRINKCCAMAYACQVRMLVDAEESWLQNAIDAIVLDKMRAYNQKETFIFTTLQMYRKDRLEYLNSLLELSRKEGFKLGIKLVRGAYIEKENNRAEEKGYPSPICSSKEATDDNFNLALNGILNSLDHCELFLGTHSEDSVLRVLDFMKANQLAPNDPRIWISQLFGMADHISFNLAKAGYQVVKYVPYGPLKEVIPYLIRRAEENTAVQGQTPRELELIQKERNRRKTLKAEQK